MSDQESNLDKKLEEFLQKCQQNVFERHKQLLQEFWQTLEGDTDE